MLSLTYNSEEDDDSDEEGQLSLAFASLILLGAEESRRLRSARRRRHYLTRSELLPNPRYITPWTHLYRSQSDRAYITTMGVDVRTFHYLLDSGFRHLWNTTPIPRQDTSSTGNVRLNARSLDAEGALGLALHYINSSTSETCLQEIFALIPSTVNRYIRFVVSLLLRVLREIPEGAVRWPGDEEFNELSQIIQVCPLRYSA